MIAPPRWGMLTLLLAAALVTAVAADQLPYTISTRSANPCVTFTDPVLVLRLIDPDRAGFFQGDISGSGDMYIKLTHTVRATEDICIAVSQVTGGTYGFGYVFTPDDDGRTVHLGTVNNGDWITVEVWPDDWGWYGTLNPADVWTVTFLSPSTPPVAAFSANVTSGFAPLPVQFTDASTASPTAWSWTFGDGGASANQHPVHTYASPGTYTVSLTATNADGSDTETKTGYITVNAAPTPPVAAFTGTPTAGIAPLAVQFTDASTGNATAWSWIFGDGNTSANRHPVHTYASPGTYTVALNASNAYGYSIKTRTDYITVLPLPAAGFTTDVTAGNAPLSVQFTDTSTGNVAAWSWTFGDGNTSALQNPVHTYAAPGTYTVTLNASNAYGYNLATKTNYITVLPPPAAGFTANVTEGNAPLMVQFTDTTGGNVTAWSWDFGDGNGSAVQNPVHTYAAPGTYTVTLNASNAYGYNLATKTNYITVLPPPAAGFTANVTEGNAPLMVQFTDASTGNVAAWSWTFGDGNTSALQHPVHTYAAPGTYTVTLNASNAYGSNTLTRAGYITATAVPVPPVASFTGTPTTGTAPLTVQFTDTSMNAPTAWYWDFGDGGTSRATNPAHTYTAGGTYTVTLTVTNAGGSDTETRTDYIAVSAAPPPQPRPLTPRTSPTASSEENP